MVQSRGRTIALGAVVLAILSARESTWRDLLLSRRPSTSVLYISAVVYSLESSSLHLKTVHDLPASPVDSSADQSTDEATVKASICVSFCSKRPRPLWDPSTEALLHVSAAPHALDVGYRFRPWFLARRIMVADSDATSNCQSRTALLSHPCGPSSLHATSCRDLLD